MSILVKCPNCHFSALLKDYYAGKRVKCPHCQRSLAVPAPAGQEVDLELDVPSSAAAVLTTNHFAMILVAAAAGAVSMLLVCVGMFFLFGIADNKRLDPTTPQHAVADSIAPSPESPATPKASPQSSQSGLEATAASTPAPIASTPPVTDSPRTQAANRPTPQPNRSSPPAASPAATPDAEPVAERPLRSTIEFTSLPLEELATSMALTEDLRTLVVTHQSAGQVTFYDIDTKQTAVVKTPTPRSVTCRGGKVFIANHGEATISVFTPVPHWRLDDVVDVIKPGIVHLSAPAGDAFDGKLIVTCHGPGNQASYQDTHIYEVDLSKNQSRAVGKQALASVSYDGKLIMTQGSFNLSPSGGLTAYRYNDFIQGNAERIFAGGIQQTPYVFQPYPGSYWIGPNIVFGGVPIAEVKGDLGNLIVPDVSQKLLYSLTKEVVKAHRLGPGLTEIGMRRASYPEPFLKDFSQVYHELERRRSYLLDYPVARTVGDRLQFFVLAAKGGVILTAETKAFEVTDSLPTPPITNASPAPASPPSGGKPSADIGSAALAALPKMIVAGQTRRASLKLPSGATAELMTQLPGASLSKTHVWQWTPSAEQTGLHELKFRIEHNGAVSVVKHSLEVIPAELAAAVGGDLSRLNDFHRLPLEIDHFSLHPSHNRQELLLLQGDLLKRLTGDGVTLALDVQLPKRYSFLREREDTYVAIATSPEPVLDVLDKSSRVILKSIDLKQGTHRVLDVTDLAVHPAIPRSYVAIKHDIDLPRYMVLSIDEAQGTVETPGIIGTWVEISPYGQTLYTGYRDIYQRGSRFHINPGWRLIEVPEYGNLDMLFRWDIADSHTATQSVREAGGNGYGIRLSPDGKRLTYLSHVGTPEFSKNLAGFDTDSFDDAPVRYETKDRAVTTELAFHPFLPLVAVPGGNSAVLFHRETGEVLEQRLLLTSRGLGEVKVERIMFAPDGEHLVFVCGDQESGRYLRSVRLHLRDDERDSRLEIPPVRAPVKPGPRE